jgi:hypothetical protein
MAATEITGTVTRIELKDRAPYDPYIGRYSPQTSYREFYADVAIETEEDTVYFKTPAVMRTVTSGGPFAIVNYGFPARGNGFLEEVGEDHVATPGKPNNNVLKLTVREGDTITIEGRVKAKKVSRKGNPYRSVNYVILKENHALHTSEPCGHPR